jgi:hypothetical protein
VTAGTGDPPGCAVRWGVVGDSPPVGTGRVPLRGGCFEGPLQAGARSLRSGSHQALGDHVRRSLLVSLGLSLALIAAVVPAVLAVDPAASGSVAPLDPAPGAGATPSDPASSASVAPPDDVNPPDDGTPPDGNISIDPSFITPAPGGGVLAATGRPDPTLPPTDTTVPTTDVGGATLAALLATLAVTSSLLLLVGRPPAARRR